MYGTKTKAKTIVLVIPRVTNNYECYLFAICRCPLMGTRVCPAASRGRDAVTDQDHHTLARDASAASELFVIVVVCLGCWLQSIVFSIWLVPPLEL